MQRVGYHLHQTRVHIYSSIRQSFVNSPGNCSRESVMMQLELMGYLLVETTDVSADIGSDRGETFRFILSYN